MREEYDFSQSVKNPYLEQLHRPITIDLEEEVIEYFEEMAESADVPYKALIGLYLKDCVRSQREVPFTQSP